MPSFIFYDGLGYIYIDLTNFTKTLEECHTEVDKWIHELIHMLLRKSLPPEFKHTIFEKFYSIGEYANLSKEEQHMTGSWLIPG
ncbi:PD-(D/E)XK nuclease family transposase [Pedobacter sp. JY14-1]|uniref:PD-(D/E)XK nuclease family transposase n=1 Tax=Pedobacter sp. JY14-1 TaxID=3034151 RepID=UPI0023E2B64A|nr:PD-(D/E)XK nuclease family transposase [Pedobacter sp. JY14-1]